MLNDRKINDNLIYDVSCMLFYLQKSKSPTCPLCKVPFDFITFREMGHTGEDGSCAVLDERIVQIGQQIPQETRYISLPSLRTVSTFSSFV